MIPHDYYDNNDRPEYKEYENNEVCYDPRVSDADEIVPINACIGQGPMGKGLVAETIVENDDTFIFGIYNTDGENILNSKNLHAGHISFTEDDEDDPKEMIVTLTRGADTPGGQGTVKQYGIKLPKPVGSFIFQTVEDWKPLEYQADYIYQNISKDLIYNISGHEVKIGDSLMFTIYKKDIIGGEEFMLYYLAFGVIENVTTNSVTAYASLYSPLYSLASFIEGVEEYVDAKVQIEKNERIAADGALSDRIDQVEARSDVVDVVGTKAQLDAYDVSKLTKDDLIKVLHDETKDFQTTYYRFNKITKAKRKKNAAADWTYVGCSGPFVLQDATAISTVYGKSSSGKETNVKYSNGTAGNSLALRTSDGTILSNSDAGSYTLVNNTRMSQYVNPLISTEATARANADATLQENINNIITDYLPLYARLDGATFSGGVLFQNSVVFNSIPRTPAGVAYISADRLLAGEGIEIEATTEGLVITNAVVEMLAAAKGDIIFTTELDTEKKVKSKKGGKSWELLSSEGGVYEWHCLEGGRPVSEVTTDIEDLELSYDYEPTKYGSVLAMCDDDDATLTWETVEGDSAVIID